jgi:uncharacterized protein (TIGR04168 family)
MPEPRDSFCILVVGDVHGRWDEIDQRFVESGDQDLVLFVGDLGDEDVSIARRIAELDVELGVILGNHDAWESFRQKRPTESLRRILDLLGEDHLGYVSRELPAAGLTLIGARPFSWGGRDLRSPEVYGEFYGVRSHEESAARIVDLASRAHHEDLLILAHNGPKGLGKSSDDIWGKDFGRPGGDWGDRDLQLAVEQIRQGGQRVRAVIAGHMHDRLFHPRGALRRRFFVHGKVRYMNAAVVPRIRRFPDGELRRHYLRTEWRRGQLRTAEEIWVGSDGQIAQVDPIPFESEST